MDELLVSLHHTLRTVYSFLPLRYAAETELFASANCTFTHSEGPSQAKRIRRLKVSPKVSLTIEDRLSVYTSTNLQTLYIQRHLVIASFPFKVIPTGRC